MSLRTNNFATMLGIGRVALGFGYMATPRLVDRASFGSDPDSPELQVTARMLGAKEVYLGAAIIVAARAKSPFLSMILVAGAIADTWDACAALATHGTSRHTKFAVAGVALTSSLLALATAAPIPTVQ